MGVVFLSVSIFLHYLHAGTCGSQKKALDPLGLQTVRSCHVNVGNQTWVPWKSRQCS